MAAVAEKAGSFGHEIDRTAEPLIRARGVWKIFGRNADKIVGTPDADLPRAELRAKHDCVAAVRDVSFEVWPREVFVVMGLSGSGKSTLVRTLIRLIEPTAGADRDRRAGRHRGERRPSCARCAATRRRWSSSTSACSPTGA